MNLYQCTQNFPWGLGVFSSVCQICLQQQFFFLSNEALFRCGSVRRPKGVVVKKYKAKNEVFQVSYRFALFTEQNEAHIINKNFANSGRFSLGDLESTRTLPFLPLFFVRESMCVRLTFAGVFVYGVLSLSLWPHPWNSGCSIFPEHGSGILWPDSTNSKTTSLFSPF